MFNGFKQLCCVIVPGYRYIEDGLCEFGFFTIYLSAAFTENFHPNTGNIVISRIVISGFHCSYGSDRGAALKVRGWVAN